ncbi:MAG TPA: SDR family NAD(P)-dependent oxidoreductase [Streptosporangiaceae bacterium]|jgi:NAD(P)-dependent dehydrogenase (short-subunit alcohol dehydrogenase family)
MTTTPTVFITGATDGLGRSLAHQLAADGVTVILHGRDAGRLAATADEIAALSGQPPQTLLADLADLAQVRRLAAGVREVTPRLDAFVSNAGIGSGEPDGHDRRVSVDGFELRFAVNYLAGFLLTMELLPLLLVSAPARVVNVASLGQHPLDFSDLMLTRGYSGTRAYGQSKLAQIMSGFELARRVGSGQITVNSLHPATYMPTKMVLLERGESVDTLTEGMMATRRLAVGPALAGVTGKFFNRTAEARASAQAYDPAARAQLWDESRRLTGAPGLA